MSQTQLKSTSETADKTPGVSKNPRGLAGVLLLLVGVWPLVFFWRAALGIGMFYFGDIARFFYPTRLLYAAALHAGRLPLWTPEILLGFPLFAEMQTGALYPLHLVLYSLLPTDLALNYDVLLHLAWLAAGTFLFARSRGISAAGAGVAALAFSAGGFGTGRITHLSVLAVAAWLPWALLVYDRWHRTPRLGYWVLLVIIWALQFLAGHPQFMLLNVLTFGAYVLGTLFVAEANDSGDSGSGGWKGLSWRRLAIDLIPVFTVLLGAGIAAVQLIPTAELAQASARAGGVTEAFFTEFSYHPLFLGLLFDPFILGNPYPRVSVEVIAYFGALPLLLAALGVFLRRRQRETWFWVILVLACFLLALGGFNPLYRGLRYLPLLNFFRVPARFLFPLSLAVSMLAGFGFDALYARAVTETDRRRAVFVGMAGALLIALVVVLTSLLDVEMWVLIWRGLPFVFWGLALALVILAWRKKIGRATVAVAAVALTLLDLAAFGAVYAGSYNVIAPQAEIFPTPRVLPSLALSDGARIRTSEWVYPWISVMRESLYPNLDAIYGVQSAHGYTPLIPHRTQEFLDHLSPYMFNLVGGRYYLVPQVLPVAATSEAADLNDPFMIHPIEQPLAFMPTAATGIEVESALAQSVDLRDGDVVADIVATTADGRTLTAPLRAGYDTAEWAYERSDVQKVIKHREPPIASTFAARSAFPIQEHLGHTFLGTLTLSPTPVAVTRIQVKPHIPAGLLYIQKLVLTDGDSRVDVAPLVGKASHRLVYRSEDVAVFENPDYAPRAWITHNAVTAASDDEAFAKMESPDFGGELLLADGEPIETDLGQMHDETVNIVTYEPERVAMQIHANSDGYLVLADAWDSGWQAFIDGQRVPVHRADVLLRAVQVGPGDHRVEFLYRPVSFYAGAIVSGFSVAVLGIIAGGTWLWRRTKKTVDARRKTGEG